MIGATAVRLAAHDAKMKLFEVAAEALETEPGELKAEGGKVFVAADTSRSLTFKEAASKMPGEVIDVTVDRKKQYETFRGDIAGTQFAEVEVAKIRWIKMIQVGSAIYKGSL